MNKDGSMDVILSTNFFRHIVPKEYQTSYGAMKKWLIDHNVIGANSTPQGIGYRIPTQGLSSTFSFKVVDVLPDRFSDTIVVPDEFTAMTGSDFDVDKLYIAMLNYDIDGNIVQYTSDKVSEQSPEALQNMIIQNYQLVVSDTKNMAETRASIDTLTGMLQDDVLPLISSSSKQEADPFYELLPSF
nr:MAG: RNA polymerase Rpb1, domain 2 [Bacteriophage sp.]